jgi:hypothetical protein
MSEWIAIEDRYPPYGKFIILACYTAEGKRIWVTEGFRESTDRYGEHYVQQNAQKITSSVITHWMPLPELPK